jgi:hypothetical protein
VAVVAVGLTVLPYNATAASNNASDPITPVCAGVRSVAARRSWHRGTWPTSLRTYSAKGAARSTGK